MTRTSLLAMLVSIFTACSPAPTADAGTGCQAMLDPPNLVQNGGFECGEALEWAAQFGELALVGGAHSGSKAVQVTATASGSAQLGYATAVVKPTSGKTYCVTAWVKGTATGMKVEGITKAGLSRAFSTPVEANWVRAPPSTKLELDFPAGDELFLRMSILNGTAGQTLIVDDVDVFESASGKCTER